ncbi:hypothetical protein [Bacillus benzoevorans]|uniref:Uncharacterized protein n=1 Tax=Bacillus benzoevorans TaxID=1456 RepID=A0A7X0HVT8_9BACI|nr:hypothetical protein [Bacillus benzoevorans]MBB6446511.1 hypothetical protein [Bacillus benzoevorans]
MNLTNQALWAELKFKVLESALMLQDGYSDNEVIGKLMEVVEILNNTEPKGD